MKKLSITILFFGIVFLAGCGTKNDNQNIIEETFPERDALQDEINREVPSEEMIEFENPGTDEIGKKIEGFDYLINSTSTEGYGDDFSGEVLAELE